MEYIKQIGKVDCIFCDKLKVEDDREALVLHRAESSFLVLNKYPYNSGHLMVAPYRHVNMPSELSAKESEELFSLLVMGENLLKEAYNPDGMNVGANIGKCAGAGVVGHFHLHIVPRWLGDTNFMPVFDGTKCVPQALSESYDTMKSILDRDE
jgi:ATP adenylyltransferase